MNTYKVNDRVRIENDDVQTIYVVAGIHPERGIWLTIEDEVYEGYDADLIIANEEDGVHKIIQADQRTKYGHTISLVFHDTRLRLPHRSPLPQPVLDHFADIEDTPDPELLVIYKDMQPTEELTAIYAVAKDPSGHLDTTIAEIGIIDLHEAGLIGPNTDHVYTTKAAAEANVNRKNTVHSIKRHLLAMTDKELERLGRHLDNTSPNK